MPIENNQTNILTLQFPRKGKSGLKDISWTKRDGSIFSDGTDSLNCPLPKHIKPKYLIHFNDFLNFIPRQDERVTYLAPAALISKMMKRFLLQELKCSLHLTNGACIAFGPERLAMSTVNGTIFCSWFFYDYLIQNGKYLEENPISMFLCGDGYVNILSIQNSI